MGMNTGSILFDNNFLRVSIFLIINHMWNMIVSIFSNSKKHTVSL